MASLPEQKSYKYIRLGRKGLTWYARLLGYPILGIWYGCTKTPYSTPSLFLLPPPANKQGELLWTMRLVIEIGFQKKSGPAVPTQTQL